MKRIALIALTMLSILGGLLGCGFVGNWVHGVREASDYESSAWRCMCGMPFFGPLLMLSPIAIAYGIHTLRTTKGFKDSVSELPKKDRNKATVGWTVGGIVWLLLILAVWQYWNLYQW